MEFVFASFEVTFQRNESWISAPLFLCVRPRQDFQSLDRGNA
jgi:hypothetical protein